jgi:hypothetical protein
LRKGQRRARRRTFCSLLRNQMNIPCLISYCTFTNRVQENTSLLSFWIGDAFLKSAHHHGILIVLSLLEHTSQPLQRNSVLSFNILGERGGEKQEHNYSLHHTKLYFRYHSLASQSSTSSPTPIPTVPWHPRCSASCIGHTSATNYYCQ